MNTVISRLLVYVYNCYNRDIYYEMSLYILSNLSIIDDMTASEFAKNCHTSLSTVKKFCKILGYKDFNVMKQYLFSTIDIRKKQIEQRYKEFNIDNLLNEIEIIGKEKIDKNQYLIALESIVDEIYKAKNVYIIAANYPLFLSFNFIEDFLIFNKSCYIQNVDLPLHENFKEESTFGLLISATGRYFMLNKIKSESILDVNSKIALISQNVSMKDKVTNLKTFIDLPGKQDSESLNLIILNILILIKFIYYQKYMIK